MYIRGLSDVLSDLLEKSSVEFVMTAKELAKKTKIAESTISGYKNDKEGKQNPTAKQLCSMADNLGVSVDYLLGRTKDKGNNPDKNYATKELGLSSEAQAELKKHSWANEELPQKTAYTYFVNILIEKYMYELYTQADIGITEMCHALENYMKSWDEEGETAPLPEQINVYELMDWRLMRENSPIIKAGIMQMKFRKHEMTERFEEIFDILAEDLLNKYLKLLRAKKEANNASKN